VPFLWPILQRFLDLQRIDVDLHQREMVPEALPILEVAERPATLCPPRRLPRAPPFRPPSKAFCLAATLSG
jgi:hypothetical protein